MSRSLDSLKRRRRPIRKRTTRKRTTICKHVRVTRQCRRTSHIQQLGKRTRRHKGGSSANESDVEKGSENNFKEIQKNTKYGLFGVNKMEYFGTPTEAVIMQLVMMFQEIEKRKRALSTHTLKTELTTLIQKKTNGIMMEKREIFQRTTYIVHLF